MSESRDDDALRSELEDSFFSRSRKELRAALARAAQDRSDQMQALADVSGIRDVATLERLALLGIRAETLAALALYPFVAVAWADGRVDRLERDAVMSAVEEFGVEPGSMSHELIGDWLESPPDEEIGSAWKAYVHELCRPLDGERRAFLQRSVLSRARTIAEASGGFLALDKTSESEQDVLDDLAASFR